VTGSDGLRLNLSRKREQRGPGEPREHFGVTHHYLEVGDRKPGVLAGNALGARALAVLYRLDQREMIAVGDHEDVPRLGSSASARISAALGPANGSEVIPSSARWTSGLPAIATNRT